MGFCLSLIEPSRVNPQDYLEEEREFNRYTLLGEYDPLFLALLKERCRADGVAERELAGYFRAHMNRGAVLLQNRVRSIADIPTLLKEPRS
jgi:DNA sulfur modification protein DndE